MNTENIENLISILLSFKEMTTPEKKDAAVQTPEDFPESDISDDAYAPFIRAILFDNKRFPYKENSG
jgi:hypothetical protein